MFYLSSLTFEIHSASLQEDIRNIEAGRVPLPLYGSTRSDGDGAGSGRDGVRNMQRFFGRTQPSGRMRSRVTHMRLRLVFVVLDVLTGLSSVFY